MKLSPLPTVMLEPLVRAALLEDLGRAGDVTIDAVVPKEHHARTMLAARQSGVVAGLDLAMLAFSLIDPDVEISVERADGSHVAHGEVIASVVGPARAILTAERTALNFLCHLSGIATATASIVASVRGHGAKIVCTRKTTPGLRAVEKYAVRAGGGSNHHFGLDDAILIEDNHIAIAGDIRPALERVRKGAGHLVKIEVEVDTLCPSREMGDSSFRIHGLHFRPFARRARCLSKECNVMEERLKFIARLLDGEKMAVLCREFDISRKTGYKILARYNDSGLEGLTDRSRRPYRHAPHQANARIFDAVGRSLGIADRAVVKTIAEYGNSSAATIPLSLSLPNRRSRFGWARKSCWQSQGRASAAVHSSSDFSRITGRPPEGRQN